MKVSVSFLSEVDRLESVISDLERSSTDYIHLDIMDGSFVSNINGDIDKYEKIFSRGIKPLDIHLMVEDVKTYASMYSRLKPEFITFHYEAGVDISDMIDFIHFMGCKCGISIKPDTPVSDLLPYLGKVDLVLVMSVLPGEGGQQFIESSVPKIDELVHLRSDNNYQYLIEVDGGIDSVTSMLCSQADILVSGSYIFKDANYEQKIMMLQTVK